MTDDEKIEFMLVLTKQKCDCESKNLRVTHFIEEEQLAEVECYDCGRCYDLEKTAGGNFMLL